MLSLKEPCQCDIKDLKIRFLMKEALTDSIND